MKTPAIIITIGLLALITGYIILNSNNQTTENNANISYDNIEIIPIEHASLVIKWDEDILVIDPTGDASQYNKFGAPDFIFITDIHGDHLSTSTLQDIDTEKSTLITPDAVMKQLGGAVFFDTIEVMDNGDRETLNVYSIQAIPMYNVPETEDAHHSKGRGNGYVIEKEGVRIYVAGDTGNHRLIRGLKNIDIAFVPMNLPFTMSVEEAAEATLAFAPKIVYPYHYREKDGFSNIEKFKELVNKENSAINVKFGNWYPKRELGTSIIETTGADPQIQEEFEKAAELNTAASYQAFIKANRNHPLADEARFELNKLRGIRN